MDRRAFVPLAASAALAQEPGIRVELVSEPTGDHLAHYRRVANCKGVAEFREGPVREPHLVVVSLEPHRMPAAIESALERGAHVLVEKPACADLAPFEAAARKADRVGRQVMLAMATRLDPAAIRARDLVRSGAMGSGYGADLVWVADQTRLRDPAYHRSWKSSRRLGGGGKLAFHGVHYIDLLHYISGARVERVCGFARNVGGQPIEVEDAAVVSMVLSNGMVATLNTGYYLDRGYANSIAYWGSDGWFRFEPRQPHSLAWHARDGDGRLAAEPSLNVYDRMLQAAVDFARGVAPPFITTAESVAALRAVFAAYRAADTGVSQKV
jgi:predicted dehydrogenase